jgi:pantetheine-phosphate adenylyltransferase
MVKAVYPGTFDPLTRGHEDIVRRASHLFASVAVGVADSRGKRPFFTLAERIEMARAVLAPYPGSMARASSCAACARSRISSTSFRWPG